VRLSLARLPTACRRGPGALGDQPILLPGESYEYEPACLLRTAAGCIEGHYEMWTLCAGSAVLAEAGWGEPFRAVIGRVGLRCEPEDESA
jgi:uncharacterized protein affecting Mg2+/Co2+ transport